MFPSFVSTLSALLVAAALASSLQAQTSPNASSSAPTIAGDESDPPKFDSEPSSRVPAATKADGASETEKGGDEEVEQTGGEESPFVAQQVAPEGLGERAGTMERRLGLFKKNQQQPAASSYPAGAYYSECERCLASAGGWPSVPAAGAELPVVARYPQAMLGGQPSAGMMLPLKSKFQGKFQFGKPFMFGEPLFGANHYQAARYRSPMGFASPAPFHCVQTGGQPGGGPGGSQEETKGAFLGGPY